MYCNKCGNQINSGDQFCNKCGNVIQSNNTQRVNETQPNSGNGQQELNNVHPNNSQSFQGVKQNNQVNPIHQEFGTPNQSVNNNQFQSQTNSNVSQNLNNASNNQFNQHNQNNNKNFDIKKYLPFIIGGVIVILVIIFVINGFGGNDNNIFNNNGNNNSNNNNDSNSNNNSQDGKLNRNYKVNSPASENSLKSLSFNDGEKYLKDIGFTEIEKGKFAYGNYDSYDYDGYTARNTVYKDDWYNDVVEIIFNNNQIFLCEISLVYLKDDMNIDTVYNDLSKLMSAFNGYKLDKAKLQSALTSAENYNDPNYSSKFGSETYFIGDVGFDITISISPQTEYSKAKYTFEIRQGYK